MMAALLLGLSACASAPKTVDPKLLAATAPRDRTADDRAHDADQYPALIAPADESNRLVAIESDCLDALLDYPGRSAADVACKLAAVLDIWRATGGLDDYHEQVAMKLMVDAERTLYDLLPPARLPIVASS